MRITENCNVDATTASRRGHRSMLRWYDDLPRLTVSRDFEQEFDATRRPQAAHGQYVSTKGVPILRLAHTTDGGYPEDQHALPAERANTVPHHLSTSAQRPSVVRLTLRAEPRRATR
jgi:hypothetical protein